MNTSPVRTRFAPSPTGQLHLGNIRTALFNVLLAKKTNGVFLLRIEDTDQQRSKEEHVVHLKEDLKWLGLDWQEGPYFQSQRQELYNGYYQALIDRELAYPCFCTESQLALNRKAQLAAGQPPRYAGICRKHSTSQVQARLNQGDKPTLRFKVPEQQAVRFTDHVKGNQVFQTQTIGDFIIRRTDGTAPFLFCNAIDDALMKITHVLRGEDHLANTPRQILVLQALNLAIPHYAHVPLVLGATNSPLSKRDQSQTVLELRELGFLPLAIWNYLARLGHTYDNNALLSVNELAQHFDFTRFSTSSGHFDDNHLLHWQKETLLKSNPQEIWSWLKEGDKKLVPAQHQIAFAGLMQNNARTLEEVHFWTKQLFVDPVALEENARAILKDAPHSLFKAAISAFERHPDSYQQAAQLIAEETKIQGKKLHQPLRAALTGVMHGPELKEVVHLLGLSRIISRLQHATTL